MEFYSLNSCNSFCFINIITVQCSECTTFGAGVHNLVFQSLSPLPLSSYPGSHLLCTSFTSSRFSWYVDNKIWPWTFLTSFLPEPSWTCSSPHWPWNCLLWHVWYTNMKDLELEHFGYRCDCSFVCRKCTRPAQMTLTMQPNSSNKGPSGL